MITIMIFLIQDTHCFVNAIYLGMTKYHKTDDSGHAGTFVLDFLNKFNFTFVSFGNFSHGKVS